MGYEKDIYIWPGFSAWGFGTWKDRWESLEWDHWILEKWLEVKKNETKLNSIATHVLKNYRSERDKGESAGDTIICINLVKSGQYSIFPTISKVRNVGHDGSGLHCGKTDKKRFSKQRIDDGENLIHFENDLKPDPEIYKRLKNYFKTPLNNKLKGMIKNIIQYTK